MNAKQTYADIQKLPAMAGAIRQKEPQAIRYLQDLYLRVTGSTVYAGCKNCHLKAATYLTSLTIEKLKAMSNVKFKLKDNAMINYPFGSGDHYTNKNITDEKAAEILKAQPSLISEFADYPKDSDGKLQLEETKKETKKADEKAAE